LIRTKSVRRNIRICRKPRRRFGRGCLNFRRAFASQFKALGAANKKLRETKASDRLTVRVEIAKIRAEIYGNRAISGYKKKLDRLISQKKKRTFPALEKKIADMTAIYNASKTHFASGTIRKTQADLFKLAKKQGCKRVGVRRIRFFHGKRVSKGKTVRRVVIKSFSVKYKKRLNVLRRNLRTATDAKRK